MITIRIPERTNYCILALAPLSCLIFILYISGAFWMFFACLFAYLIQFTTGIYLIDNTTCEVPVERAEQLKDLDSRYKNFKIAVIFSFVLTILLDLFPFFATLNWFCYDMGIHMRRYEGGVLVSIMTIFIIILLICIIIHMNYSKLKLPTDQYYKNIKLQEQEAKRLVREKELEEARIEQNLSKYGEGYIEICPEFIFNEKKKKVWLIKKEYSFDEIIDASIEDNTSEYTMGGDIITKTKTGSILSRAVIGGALAGDVGAIIGGVTAEKESIVTPIEICTIHSYNLLIITTNLSNPLITLSFDNNARLAQICLATIKAIMHNR